MKISIIIMTMILSLSLVGSFSNSYADPGDFIASFDGSDGGGTAFVTPYGMTLYSNDLIFVSDTSLNVVQVYDLDGTFVYSFDGSDGGGTQFDQPYAITVDTDGKIIVADVNFDLVQIFYPDGTFITSFGDSTQFGLIEKLAVTSLNNILVLDSGRAIVQIFNPDGTFVRSFDGSEGIGEQFIAPSGMTIDTNDQIYIADTILDTVQIYDSFGTFVTSFDGSEGNGTPFDRPHGLAVNSFEQIIVTDTGLNSVQVYNPDGTFVTSFDGSEDGGTQFLAPWDVIVDSTGQQILVLDVGDGLVEIFEGGEFSNFNTDDGDFTGSFDGTDGGGVMFNEPRGIVVDSNGRIIVADHGEDIVQIFDSNGFFITSFDGSNGGTEFLAPWDVIVDSNDQIIVSDHNIDLVQIFDSDGLFISSFDGSEGAGLKFDQSKAIAVNSTGQIFVADHKKDIVQIYNSDGTFVTSFDGTAGGNLQFDQPYGITIDSNDRIIITDLGLDQVRIFYSDLSSAADLDDINGGATPFLNPWDVAVNSDDQIIVVDSGSKLVQIFNSTGFFITSFDGTEDGGLKFDQPYAIAVDSNDKIYVADSGLGTVRVFGGGIFSFDNGDDGGDGEIEPPKKSGSGGCADCTPPTLGLDKDGKRLVDNGFTYNGKSVDAERFFTPYPLITVNIGELNTAVFKIYENNGIQNIKHVSFAFGLATDDIISNSKAMIELDIDYDGTETVTVYDPKNALDNINVTTNVVDCIAGSTAQCLEVTMEHMFRAPLDFNIVATDVWDQKRNAWQNYFNHGIEVIGESMNPPEEYNAINRGQIYHLTETGKTTAVDEFGNNWSLKYDVWAMDYIKAPRMQDAPTEIMTRNHSEFVEYKKSQIIDAMNELALLCPTCLDESYTDFADSFAYDIPIILEKLQDPLVQEKLALEGQRAQEIMDDLLHPAR